MANSMRKSGGGFRNPLITSADIPDGSITTTKLAALAVTSAKIADLAVTDAKIGSLSASKITAGTISAQTITLSGSSGIIQSSGFSSGSAGWRIRGNGNAEFNDVTVRGNLVSGGQIFIGPNVDPNIVWTGMRANIAYRGGSFFPGAGLRFDSDNTIPGQTYLTLYSQHKFSGMSSTDTSIDLSKTNGINLVHDGSNVVRFTREGDNSRMYFGEFNDYIQYDNVVERMTIYLNDVLEFRLDKGAFIIPSVFAQSTSGGANVNISGSGWFRRSTSSRRYKRQIRRWSGSESVLGLTPSTFRSRLPDDGDDLILGLIAEEIAERFPLAAIYDDQGRPDAINWNAITAGILAALIDVDRRLQVIEGLSS